MSKLSTLRAPNTSHEKRSFSYLTVALLLLLAITPGWAMTPMSSVTVAPNTTQTLQTGPNRFYPQVTIQNRGRAIVNDEVFIQNLEVQRGGILQVTLNGMVNGAVFMDTDGDGIDDPLPTSYTLRAGAIVEVGIVQGLPFQQFFTYSIDPAVNYVFNGTVPQRTASALTGSPLEPLPGLIGSLTINNPTTVTLMAPVTMTGTLRLQNGVFMVGNKSLTLRATGQRTASIIPTQGSMSGSTVTVQRPISASANAGVGYRHLSSPVQNAPISDLATNSFTPVVNPQYNTPGASAMPFPNVFGYDQSRVSSGNTTADFDRGWFSPAATSDIMTPGQGYTVNMAGGQIVDFTGTPTAGPVVVSSQRNPGPQRGWIFAGNPYAAPISWAAVTRSGIDNAVYTYRSDGQYSGMYTSFVNNISNNGGSDTLAIAQAFFTRVSTPNTTGTITFTDAARVEPRTQPVFQRTTADTRPLLTLALGNATARTQATLYCEQGATAAFEPTHDAAFLPGANGLTLASEAGPELAAINGLPALTGQDLTVPLRLLAPATAGPCTLHVDALRHLPAGYHAYLRDALTGAFTDLTAATALPVQPTAAARYAVVFSTQSRVLATAPAELARLASVFPNPAQGRATLLLPQALRAGQATQVQVLDHLGRVVLTRSLAAGTTDALELPLNGLAPGVYSVLAKTALGSISKRLVVQ